MAVTTAKIRAREKETGKKAKIGMDSAGNLHYAFDSATLNSIILKANNALDAKNSAKAAKDAQAQADYNNKLAQQNTAVSNQFNAEQAQLNRNFQADMSNTAHQREVADLKAAGLNPVLSAGGSGASSPSGSTASGSPSSVDMGATTAAVEMAKAAINAKTQLQMNRDNITSAQAMNNKSLALQKELGLLGFDNSIATALIAQATSNYAADTAAGASRYGSDKSYESSKYASDNAYNASIYATNNPSNPLGNLVNSLAGNNDNLSGIYNTGKTVGNLISNAFTKINNKNTKNTKKVKKVVTPKGSLAK